MKKQSLELPFSPPMITINSIMTEMESDTDTMSPATLKPAPHAGRGEMCYLSPFSSVGRGDRTISEGNLSSSGYSSMASPAPSRCGSGNPLFASDMDDGPPSNGKFHKMLTLRRSSSHGKSCDNNASGSGANANDSGGPSKMRSDSETLSDDLLLESNDEGISTDHIDEKLNKLIEVFVDIEQPPPAEKLVGQSSFEMVQLQLPTIVIQCDGVTSAVSSRSESPIRYGHSCNLIASYFFVLSNFVNIVHSTNFVFAVKNLRVQVAFHHISTARKTKRFRSPTPMACTIFHRRTERAIQPKIIKQRVNENTNESCAELVQLSFWNVHSIFLCVWHII